MLFAGLQLFYELLAHHLSDHLLVLAQAILQSLEEIKEEFSNVLLLVNGYLLAIVVHNALKDLGWIPVLFVGAKHLCKQALQVQNDVPRRLQLRLFNLVQPVLVDCLLKSRQ